MPGPHPGAMGASLGDSSPCDESGLFEEAKRGPLSRVFVGVPEITLRFWRISMSVIVLAVLVTALLFDFTNGFHDTANAMATSIATGALRPKVAVALSGVLNLVAAFLSVEVALTVTNAVVKIQQSNGTPKPELLTDGGSALLLIVMA